MYAETDNKTWIVLPTSFGIEAPPYLTSLLGLGLAIAKSLEEGFGGEIRMESEVGKGSDLIFEFPKA